jgi:citrate lyase synthetase
MKIKITKQQQAEIAKIQKVIEAHQLEQDALVDGFIASMNLGDEIIDTGTYVSKKYVSKKQEVVWDYIYNHSHWMVELE